MHLILDGYGAPRERLENPDLVYKFLEETPDAIGMKRICSPFVYQYQAENPEHNGVTGFVVIAESHLSIHTWPEHGVLWADIFSCRDFDIEPVMDALREAFALAGCQTQVLRRELSVMPLCIAEMRRG